MNDFSKVLRIFAVLAVAAGLGTFIGWLVTRQGEIKPIVAPPATNQTFAVAAPVTAPQLPEPDPSAIVTNPVAKSDDLANYGPAPWEKSLDDILLSDDDVNTKADRILALIPTAPPEAKQELAQHLVNMVQDDHYDGTAQMLTNATTPVEVSDVLMNDLLNRNNNLKLPMLLAIARNPDHPLKDQALDLLGLLTQEDDGTNWDQWSTTVDTWLQNNNSQ